MTPRLPLPYLCANNQAASHFRGSCRNSGVVKLPAPALPTGTLCRIPSEDVAHCGCMVLLIFHAALAFLCFWVMHTAVVHLAWVPECAALCFYCFLHVPSFRSHASIFAATCVRLSRCCCLPASFAAAAGPVVVAVPHCAPVLAIRRRAVAVPACSCPGPCLSVPQRAQKPKLCCAP